MAKLNGVFNPKGINGFVPQMTEDNQDAIKKMSIEEKIIFIRNKINAIPLNKRVALGSKGVQLLHVEHLLLCGMDVDISEWEAI